MIEEAIDFGLRLLWMQGLLRDAQEKIAQLEAENDELRADSLPSEGGKG